MFIHYISSTVNITWSPPFTLPGTNIIGYNISVAINGSNSASLFTMESHYEFILTSVTNSHLVMIATCTKDAKQLLHEKSTRLFK